MAAVLSINVAELGGLLFVRGLGEDLLAVRHHLAQVKTRLLHRVADIDKLTNDFIGFFASVVVVVDVYALFHDGNELRVDS
jgi:hypothetical protein